jgi:hypothetical protein
MILDKEEKFKTVLENLIEKPNQINMFGQFLKMFPEEWKQLKINYSKFNRSKQFGKTIPLPKPEQSLKKELRIWLKNKNL